MNGVVFRDPNHCYECRTSDGELHVPGCGREICPYCRGKVASCVCGYELLDLFDYERYSEKTEYLHPEIFREGVTQELYEKFRDLLVQDGILPFISFIFKQCDLCLTIDNKPWFAPSKEWRRTVPKHLRGLSISICRGCYKKLKEGQKLELLNHTGMVCAKCGNPSTLVHPYYRVFICETCKGEVDRIILQRRREIVGPLGGTYREPEPPPKPKLPWPLSLLGSL